LRPSPGVSMTFAQVQVALDFLTRQKLKECKQMSPSPFLPKRDLSVRSGIHHSYTHIAELPSAVRDIYAGLGLEIRPAAHLSQMLKLCEGVDGKIGSMEAGQKLDVCRAMRVLQAIADCAGETNLREVLKRIARSSLDPATPEPSEGKDMVFELELLQYIRYRGLTAQRGEPDIVIQATFGEYFVACKTINSMNNLEKQLSSGVHQVNKLGYGCIAFNFEPHMCFEQPLPAATLREVTDQIDARLRELYVGRERLFNERLRSGRLDGVMLQMSCIADIARSSRDLDAVTHTVYYLRSGLQTAEARDRFDEFRFRMRAGVNKKEKPKLLPSPPSTLNSAETYSGWR
jgi:hypothetical protein